MTAVAGFGPLPVRVAQVKGFFEKNGLDVEVTEGLDFAAFIAALDRQFDMTITSPSVFLSAASRGLEVQAISHMQSEDPEHPNQQVVTKDESFTSIEQLEGERLGVPVLTGTGAQSVSYLLEQAGVDASDVKMVQVEYPQMADQLKAHRVAAVVSAIPFFTVLDNQGFEVSDFNVVVEAVKAATGGKQDAAIGTFYASSRKYAEEHPDVIRRWRASLRQADEWIASHDAAAREVLQEWAQIPPEVARTAPLPDFEVEITAADLQPFVTIAESAGTLRDVPDLNGLVWRE